MEVLSFENHLKNITGSYRFHSLFKNTLNLCCGDHFICIHHQKKSKHPFGIAVSKLDFEKIYMTASKFSPVSVFKNSSIQLFQQFELFLFPEKGYSSVIIPMILGEEIKKNIEICKTYLNYLSLYQPGLPEEETTNYLRILLNKINSHASYENEMNYFLGRGYGLTPSGDDILLGLSSVLYAANHPEANYFSKQLLKQSYLQTTDISRAYFYHAGYLRFDEGIHNFLYSLNDSKKQMMTHLIYLLHKGHSSGSDIVFGILETMKFMTEVYDEQKNRSGAWRQCNFTKKSKS